MEINADINGAANILEKAIPNAFEHVTDYKFLSKTQPIRLSDIKPKYTRRGCNGRVNGHNGTDQPKGWKQGAVTTVGNQFHRTTE